MSAGLPRIEVHFLIDADGNPEGLAREQRSGQAAKIEVKAHLWPDGMSRSKA